MSAEPTPWAWHQREMARHLGQLVEARDSAPDPSARLEAVLTAYAHLARQSRGHHDAETAGLLHRDEHVAAAGHQVRAMLRDLLAAAATEGSVRSDVSPEELAGYCVHALAAASDLRSRAALERLVEVTMTGLRPDVDGRSESQ